MLIVSFPLLLAGSGCGAAAGLAACNTNCPWRRVPPAGDRRTVTGRDLPRCCCAPMRMPPVRGAGVRRARLPLVRDRAAAVVGLRAGAGHPGARRRAPPAAAPPGTVPLVRFDAYPAAVVGRSPAGRRRRGDRAGGRRVGAARHGIDAARRGTGRPGRDRARLAAPPPRAGRADAAGGHVRVRPPRRRHRDPARAAIPARRGRQGRRWATRWPSSSRARSPRSPGTAGRRRTWMR